MAPKIGALCGKKKKKTQVVATKAVEKKKTCRQLLNPSLATPNCSLALGSHRKKQVLRSIEVGLHFPVGRIGCYLKEGRHFQRIGFRAPVYLTVILMYLTAEMLEFAGQAAKDNKKIYIIPMNMILGVMHDEKLSKRLAGVTIAHSSVLPNIHKSLFGDCTAEDATMLPTEDAAKSPENTTESP